jgi:hypothetical protein
VHPWRPVALAGFGFAALAMLFPFVTLPVVGVIDGIEADAWPALIPLLPVLAAAVLGDRTEAPGPGAGVALVLLACSSLVFAIVKLSDAIIAVRNVAEGSVGAGPTVLVGGALVAMVGCVVALSRAL